MYRPGTAKSDPSVLRSLVAVLASLPASENKHFREEFDTVIFHFSHQYDNTFNTYVKIGIRRRAVNGFPVLSDKVNKHFERRMF